jgi:site-specific DNA-cytosine methylase
MRWEDAAATITGSLAIDNGAAAVADPRLAPDRAPPFTPMIIAADGTWHRPLTTLELAALQSLPTVVDGKPLVLAGTSHTRWREAIGNMVPPDASRAIGEQLLRALLINALGVFSLSGTTPVWVAPDRRAL